MIPFIIRQALRFRVHVVILTIAIAGWGVWATTQQKVDAYPDISAQMVQVITTYPGRASEDVERQVTIPVEIAMRNVPRVVTIRSRTIFGLSVVQMIFEEGVENYWARQRVQEKLGTLGLPDDAHPDLGPLATAYGEIFRYEIITDGSQNTMDLRTLDDWVVIPRLLRVPGVADVSNFGGYAKEYAIVFKPAQLQRYGLSVQDVVDAVQSNNASAGGSVIPRGSMSFVIRGKGALQSIDEIQRVFAKSVAGTPVYVRDVADVQLGSPVPSGIFSKDRVDESVEGIVLMRKGENPSEVLAGVNDAVAELNASRLPEGARIKPYYDRTLLVRSTMYTVTHSVLMGITLVVLVLVFFLGRPTVALLVALTIPFSLLVAMALMRIADIPVGLLSIGAIDFGIIVDGSVIMAENIARRVGELPKPVTRQSIVRCIGEAALEVEKPLFASIFLIIAAYLPLLTLRSIEGLLFRPLALTIIFALVGALFFALVVTPVLATFLLRFGYDEWENPILKWFKPRYAHWVEVLLRWRYQVAVGTVGVFLVLMAFVAPRLGTQFLPYMDEGVIWVRVNCPEGTSLTQTSAYGGRLRELALEFPEVDFVVVQTGRNDSGTDPFPPSRMEMMIGPKPRALWKRFHTKQELLAALRNRFREEFPTIRFNFTQPIIDSVTEDTNGTSANLAVELLGDDPAVLLDLARKTRDLLKKVPGATDVAIEQEGPQPQLVIEPDRALCARYGVNIDGLNRMITTALGGSPIGALYEGERRFDITAKFDREALHSPQAIGRLPVYAQDGTPIPLAQVARIDIVDGQTIIARENGRRRITVRTDIVGRDQGGFVKEAQARFSKEISVPSPYSVEWLGMFENLSRARGHFTRLIPMTVAAIFVILLMSFRSIQTALILLLPIPFALMGATLALYVRGMNIDVSTGVGFATVFAVSIMDGVLMVRGILGYRQKGHSIDEAIVLGRLTRLRPILMTSTVAILGLLPASLAGGLGSDVQRPLATVIIWGLSSSTLLTLFVVPVFYRIFVPPLPRHDEEADCMV
ncbi:CusA/CzcA family heavy metal efflux RND transporter [Pendulispora brunnea]|uniref:CusA/CzcA family heavy metal efflux RND transporter n=1 Tax=Pendulispora brunnea TaxID=2905690 RepID=A0ABZ2KN68_9BACT